MRTNIHVLLAGDKKNTTAGIIFIALGLAFLLFSTWRYFTLLNLLEEKRFETNKLGVAALITVAFICIVVVFVFTI